MTRSAIVALGIGQCVNWGVLYYAFAVLVVPLQKELNAPTWIVTGAFSLALLMSAALAPAVGRWADRDRGVRVMQSGGFAAAGLLTLWTLLPGLALLYVVWACLGLCMAATLYEPAFVIVGRAHDDPARRLRALGTVTLFGGLASTVFLPATALLVRAAGWRGAVLALAAALAGSTWISARVILHRPPTPSPILDTARTRRTRGNGPTDPVRFYVVTAMFTLTGLASAAFVTNLLPALGERGVAPATAVMLGGLIGVMQLPGRALLMSGALAASSQGLLALSLACQAAGLGLVALGPSTAAVAGGTTVFALGAGLTTIVRPHLVQTLFSVERSGYLNGRIARQQQLARAGGPILVAWTASRIGYATVFTALAGAFVVAALVSQGFLTGLHETPLKKESL